MRRLKRWQGPVRGPRGSRVTATAAGVLRISFFYRVRFVVSFLGECLLNKRFLRLKSTTAGSSQTEFRDL
jgi:hypothetical protein